MNTIGPKQFLLGSRMRNNNCYMNLLRWNIPLTKAYHPKHAISHTLTTDFSLRSSEPSQPRGGRHKGAAVEMCVSPLGSRRRPVANAAAPGADQN